MIGADRHGDGIPVALRQLVGQRFLAGPEVDLDAVHAQADRRGLHRHELADEAGIQGASDVVGQGGLAHDQLIGQRHDLVERLAVLVNVGRERHEHRCVVSGVPDQPIGTELVAMLAAVRENLAEHRLEPGGFSNWCGAFDRF
ncbi:MAG: hypothetical protein ABW328_04685 [Ilumatobacteraceae bacterium]